MNGPASSIISPSPATLTQYPILRYFAYAHLPANLQETSKLFHDLAVNMALQCPGGPETAAGRKLLEAKDCFVRSKLN